MKLYICQEVMELLELEIKQFGRTQICLSPVLVEGTEPKAWAVFEARNFSEATAELKSGKMSIWVPRKYLSELDEQVIVRGKRGFTVGAMTDSLRSKTTQFIEKSS